MKVSVPTKFAAGVYSTASLVAYTSPWAPWVAETTVKGSESASVSLASTGTVTVTPETVWGLSSLATGGVLVTLKVTVAVLL